MVQITEIRKQGIDVTSGDIITRHPDRPAQLGEWTVTGRPRTNGWHTTITYSCSSSASPAPSPWSPTGSGTAPR